MLLPPLRTPECGDPGRDRGFGFWADAPFSCTCLSWTFFPLYFFPFLAFLGPPVGFGGSLENIDSRGIPSCSMAPVFLHSRMNWVNINFLIGPAQFWEALTLGGYHCNGGETLTFVTTNGSATHMRSPDQSASNDSSGTTSPSASSSCSSSDGSWSLGCVDVEATGFLPFGALFPTRGIIPPFRTHATDSSYLISEPQNLRSLSVRNKCLLRGTYLSHSKKSSPAGFSGPTDQLSNTLNRVSHRNLSPFLFFIQKWSVGAAHFVGTSFWRFGSHPNDLCGVQPGQI